MVKPFNRKESNNIELMHALLQLGYYVNPVMSSDGATIDCIVVSCTPPKAIVRKS